MIEDTSRKQICRSTNIVGLNWRWVICINIYGEGPQVGYLFLIRNVFLIRYPFVTYSLFVILPIRYLFLVPYLLPIRTNSLVSNRNLIKFSMFPPFRALLSYLSWFVEVKLHFWRECTRFWARLIPCYLLVPSSREKRMLRCTFKENSFRCLSCVCS